MFKKYFFFIAGIMLLASPAFAEEFNAVCDKVVDANSFLVTSNGKQYTMELAYIISPAPEQKFGAEAKEYLESLALNQKLKVIVISSKDGVKSAEVFSSKKQDSINQELVRKGLAWPILESNKKHPYDLSVRLAKKRSLGVWSDPGLKPPSEKRISAKKKAVLPPHKAGAAAPAADAPQSPSGGASGGNFLMRQNENISKLNSKKAAQEQ
jgi:endonuclease YncB( thermonuclease family)